MASRLSRVLVGSAASVLTALLATGTPARAQSAGSAVGVTFYLPLSNEAAAEAAAKAIQTPGNPSFHHFLSVSQFVTTYAASSQSVAAVESVLTQLGYTVSYVFANHLAIEATAPSSTVSSTLGVSFHRATLYGRTGRVPSGKPAIPAALRGLVRGVGGIDTVHVARASVAHASGIPRSATTRSGALVGGTPGNYLPVDFEARYDVNPIYDLGVKGSGSTIGIVTLANFYPSDAYAFWNGIGLNVSQNRLTVVDVDGGTQIAPSNALGEDESDLDTEESGAIAPDANLRVYVAPNNTNANFVDGFEAAASDNIADTVSTSWGQPEAGLYPIPLIDQPDQTEIFGEFHDVFLEMALQGQTLYVATGDYGAYDIQSECPAFGTPSPTTPVCNIVYAVQSPSDDPLTTGAGGTTIPFTSNVEGVALSNTTERAWGWDYLVSEAAAQGLSSVFPLSGYFPIGDTGGVSIYWATPWYQAGLAGITATKTGQTLTGNIGYGATPLITLPANFAGRNLPDLSTNADPFSGYQFIDEGEIENGYGGTSFVAPQLNGVTALYVQALGGRVGQINPALYQLDTLVSNDVTTGDNWGYNAVGGYDNAAGLGTLDATKLLVGLAALKLGFD